MKICSPQLGISPNSILGGEIYDRELLEEFAKNGAQIEIILPAKKPHRSIKNWNITSLAVPFVVPPHLFNLLVFPYLLSLYRKSKFDILRVHSPTFVGFAAILFKKLFPRVKVVVHYHWLGEGGVIERFVNPPLMRFADMIITDSRYMRNQITKIYPQAINKVFAVHNDVDQQLKSKRKYQKLVRQFGITTKTVTLLYMGLFIERKNPQVLISLVKKLRDKHIDVRLILCGKGPLKRRLEKTIIQCGLRQYVNFVDPVFGKEKNELFNSVDIYVHSAVTEGFSLAVIEAMAVGLPVVITDGFSAKEAIEQGKNGFLCSSENDWLDALTRLAYSQKLRSRLGRNNRVKVKKQFQWSIVGKQQYKLLQQLVKA